MELRTYQTECIDTIEAQPPGAYLAQMATGLGKTVIRSCMRGTETSQNSALINGRILLHGCW